MESIVKLLNNSNKKTFLELGIVALILSNGKLEFRS